MAQGPIRIESGDSVGDFLGSFSKMQTAWRSLSVTNAEILDQEQSDSTLHHTVSFRSATELIWGMKRIGANRSRKMGAMRPPSAKLLIPQGE
jgi:hypothetical protein